MKFKTQFNASDFPKQYETVSNLSMTIPDQSMSVKELLDRHSRGLSLSGTRVPVYNGDDDDMPDLERLDLAERQELIEAAKSEVDSIRKRHQRTKAHPDNKKDKKSMIEDADEIEDGNNA